MKNQKKVIVLGSSGHIGQAVFHKLSESYEVYGSYCSNPPEDLEHRIYCNIADTSFFNCLEQLNPEYVISSLRGAFEEQNQFHDLLSKYIRKEKERRLIFISTANVFDHDLSKPHFESDSLDAQSDYGRYKADCEKHLMEVCGEQCIIIRIPAVWGIECPRIRQLKQSHSLDTVTNIAVNITSDTRIAECIHYIIQQNMTGIFHIGTVDFIDYYELQKLVCQRLDIKGPEFKVETADEKGYQVLFSQREDMPARFRHTVEDVLAEMIH